MAAEMVGQRLPVPLTQTLRDLAAACCLLLPPPFPEPRFANLISSHQHQLMLFYAMPIQVFVVWSGTDARGMYFKSAAARFSRFSETQVTQLTNLRAQTAASNEVEVTAAG